MSVGVQLTRRIAATVDVPWLIALRKATMSKHLDASGVKLSDEDHRDLVLRHFDAIKIIQH